MVKGKNRSKSDTRVPYRTDTITTWPTFTATPEPFNTSISRQQLNNSWTNTKTSKPRRLHFYWLSGWRHSSNCISGSTTSSHNIKINFHKHTDVWCLTVGTKKLKSPKTLSLDQPFPFFYDRIHSEHSETHHQRSWSQLRCTRGSSVWPMRTRVKLHEILRNFYVLSPEIWDNFLVNPFECLK